MYFATICILSYNTVQIVLPDHSHLEWVSEDTVFLTVVCTSQSPYLSLVSW